MLTRHQLSRPRPRPRHRIANIHATYSLGQFMSQWHNIPSQDLISKKNFTHMQHGYITKPRKPLHATLWVSSPEVQPDQLPLQRKDINSSSIESPILVLCGFIISPSWEKNTFYRGRCCRYTESSLQNSGLMTEYLCEANTFVYSSA